MADGCTEPGLTGMGGVTGALGMAVLRRCAPAVAFCMAAFAVGCGSAATNQGGPAPAEVAYVRAPEGPRNYDEVRALWNDHEFKIVPCTVEGIDDQRPRFRPAPRKSAAFEAKTSQLALACMEEHLFFDAYRRRDDLVCQYSDFGSKGSEVLLSCYDLISKIWFQLNQVVRESDRVAGDLVDVGACEN